MSTIERLKELERIARTSDTCGDERMDSHENFEFIYALAEAWPKLLAVVEAARLSTRAMKEDHCGCMFDSRCAFCDIAEIELTKAMAALNREN